MLMGPEAKVRYILSVIESDLPMDDKIKEIERFLDSNEIATLAKTPISKIAISALIAVGVQSYTKDKGIQ